MKRILSLAGASACVLAAVVVALQAPSSFPLLDWAKKAPAGPARVAILLEFGNKDFKATDWSGQATVTGAKIIHREGYRFRDTDKLVGSDAWQAKSRPQVRAPKGQPAISKLLPIATVGVVLHLDGVQPNAKIALAMKDGQKASVTLGDVVAGKEQTLLGGQAVARLVTAAQPVAVTKNEEDFPAAAHGPDGTLWVAYTSYTVRDDSRRIEAPNLKGQPKDFKSYFHPDFADQVFVKSLKDGQWSAPIAVTAGKGSIARCAIGVDGHGGVHVAYCDQRKDGLNLFVRKIDAPGKAGAEEKVSAKPGNRITPVMTTDARGNVWLAVQAWDQNGKAGIEVYSHAGGRWALVRQMSDYQGNMWHPVLAAAPNGDVALAYDAYHNGSYDIGAHIFEGATPAKFRSVTVAASPKFEARPSIVYDSSGRLWIAYEEGREKWGKDYGSLAPGKGNPLYSARSVRVVCLDTDGQLKQPTAELPTSGVEAPVIAGDAARTNLFERSTRFAYPKIGIDGAGRIWLTYRRSFGSRYSSHPGSYWLSFARRLDGQAWSDPIEMHHSDGLLDYRPDLLPQAGGGLLVVHNTDGRYTTPNVIDNQIYVSTIDLPAKATVLQLVKATGVQPGPAVLPDVAAENAAVKRMREHRIKAGGKTLQLMRGEYHRHTEISWDGGADGSLEDMFRYAIDASQLDWIGNGDHDNGAGREYSWWLTQKFSDAYFGKAFTTMFTYERSVAYPHGHRNVMFAQRGVMTLPRLAPPPGAPPKGEGKKKGKGGWPAGVHPDDAKMLYRYLHEFGGICASHTSATGMGTDWRDNDPAAEPIVEIYQGDRNSYEMQGAPRAGYDPQSGKLPANIAGWYPKGYINLALQKGYKFGFQSSSDHWSTHISFFNILTEGRDRQSLMKAIKKRHCYASTDNILLDFRCGDSIMGDEIQVAKAPTFDIYAVGTGNIAKIDVLRDSDVIDTLKPGGAEFKGQWTDAKAQPGRNHYYYVRLVQADGEVAWGSPIWVALKK